ncbi:MAG: OmpA family protein, partial [Muribaculaceae bacterium]|nr:OmpA family protein [Muribaculaceae bacterium]
SDIEAAEPQPQQHVGQKGSYELKYVNGYNPDIVALLPEAEEEEAAAPVVVEKKRGCMPWFWALLAILAIVLLALLLSRGCCDKGACGATDATMVETSTVDIIDEPTAGATTAETDAGTAATATATTAATASPEVIAQLEKYQKEFDAIEYPVGEYRLKPEAKTILDRVATVLKDNPGVKMTVNGYASREGNVEANQILSDKRAATVVDYLVGKGVAADRLKAVGLCSSNPVSDQLAPNRRIDFVVE